jgi:hypothetical protein
VAGRSAEGVAVGVAVTPALVAGAVAVGWLVFPGTGVTLAGTGDAGGALTGTVVAGVGAGCVAVGEAA